MLVREGEEPVGWSGAHPCVGPAGPECAEVGDVLPKAPREGVGAVVRRESVECFPVSLCQVAEVVDVDERPVVPPAAGEVVLQLLGAPCGFRVLADLLW